MCSVLEFTCSPETARGRLHSVCFASRSKAAMPSMLVPDMAVW